MKIMMCHPDELTPCPDNPRINDDAVNAVASSIQEFGFRQPIVVDENMMIIVGHTRWRAAKQLGLEEVPIHVASELDAQQAAAYRVLDNRSAEFSMWSEGAAAHIAEITIDNAEVNKLLADLQSELEKLERGKKEAAPAAAGGTDGDRLALLPHEHYDYVVILARNSSTWNVLLEKLGIKREVLSGGVKKKTRIGICRAITAEQVLERLTANHPE